MGISTKISKDNIFILSIILLSIILTFIFSTQKINYHIDELMTYSLSNSTSYIDITPGETYKSYGMYQEQFLTTTEESNFDYEQVWQNQANDVHPPFYYVLIHTISSFMPGEFSKYIGIAVNMFFNGLIILLLFKFSMLLTNNRNIAYITSLFWAVNPGVISDMMFIRMYIMTMFFCLLISYIHLKHVQTVNTYSYKFYLALFFVSLTGILTHYYFLIFTFFICALFVFYLLVRKRWMDLLIYIGTYVGILISAIGVFPYIYRHIFGGGQRGAESMENFMNINDYLISVKTFWQIISNSLFGGYLFISIVAIVLMFLVAILFKRSQSVEITTSLSKIIYLFSACCLYFLLISNIAVYTVERYIQPIFPILVLMFVCLLYHAVMYYLNRTNSLYILSAFLIIICINGYWHTTSFEYLIKNSEEALNVAEQYQEKNVVYLYDRNWKIPTNYMELANYKSVTFYDRNDLAPFYQNTNYEEFVLYIHSEDESIVNSIVDRLPNIDNYTKLNSYGYCVVYYLE
ncbi:hypothetical protein [Gracilibacillus salinarum]|uniref:Glycosyltransferase RgtA/B/C/D-like domain-containing protein n=1 Tax=Gracilibacillus salinarum TaxID=2932255 RepID=A0ABY4GRM0_9BACI|nr:hypothetical protein [Gracilibacillus salinarum]UOQ87041.1 hypothetical protein MUN87_09235 [Gracilibacillus salinarum]